MPGEAVAQAVLEVAPKNPTNLTNSEKIAEQITRSLNEKGANSTLEGFKAQRPLDQGRNKAAVDKNIGTARNADGTKNRNTEEEKRYEKAETYRKLGEDFFEKGYDSLQDEQKRQLSGLVKSALNRWPEGRALLKSFKSSSIIEKIIKNPAYAAKLRPLFEGAMDSSNDLADTVTDARKRFEEADKKLNAKEKEISDVDIKIADIWRESDKFRAKDASDPTAKSKEEELQELRLQGLDDEKREAAYDLNDLESRKAYLENRRSLDEAEKEELTGIGLKIKQKRIEADRIDKAIIRRNILQAEKSSFAEQTQELEDRKTALQEERKGLEGTKLEMQADYNAAQIDRASEEEAFVKGLEKTFSEAAMQYLEEKIAAAEEEEITILEKQKEEAKEPEEKALLESILNRWDEKKKKGLLERRKVTKFKKKQINSDFELLVTHGPEELVRQILSETSGINKGKFEEKMKDDPVFREKIEKLQPQVIERLLTRRIQTGKMTEEDARVIVESKWGEGMIEKAIANNKAVKDAIDQLKDKGVIEQDWIKKKTQGSVLKLLLLLFGSIATAGVLPAGMAMTDVLHGSINK